MLRRPSVRVAAGGAIGGTLTSAISFTTASAPVVDAAAQAVRSNLVSQFNGILAQITTTAQDASFNGVNLLGGDQLKLTFNETGKSTLNITGVTFNAAGLGLANLTSGTDFIDNSATNKVIANLAAPRPCCARRGPPWVRTCRSCRSVRTSRRT